MNITVHLYGKFRKPDQPDPLPVEIEEETTVSDLMDAIEVPATVYRMALVNGIRVKEDARLHDGDDVHIFQPIGGG